MQKVAEKYGVGSVTDRNWKRIKTEKQCSARALKHLKERKNKRKEGKKKDPKMRIQKGE
jgi:uncharacterized protein YjcR